MPVGRPRIGPKVVTVALNPDAPVRRMAGRGEPFCVLCGAIPEPNAGLHAGDYHVYPVCKACLAQYHKACLTHALRHRLDARIAETKRRREHGA